MRSLHPGSRSASRVIHRQESLHVVLFVHIQVSRAPSVSAILYLDAHLGILIFFPFLLPFFFCLFVSSCLMGFLTLVYQVSPMQGPWAQALSLTACLPPACSLGSPLSTFLTPLIITPLGPACSRHLRSLAGRFVSPFPSLSRPPAPFLPSLPPLMASVLTPLLFRHPPQTLPLPSSFFHTLPSSPQPFFLRKPPGWVGQQKPAGGAPES